MRLTAGKYWVGDLCYLIEDDWGKVCDFLGTGSQPNEGIFEIKGQRGAIFSTAYGDGVYYDREGNEFGVDSGTLGIFPAGIYHTRWAELGKVFDFAEDFPVECVDGEMKFGHIRIRTKGAACPIFKAKVRRKDEEERVFYLEIVSDCYFSGSATYPGVRFADPESVNNFVGDEMASEIIEMSYSEGSCASGEQEDEDGKFSFSWQMLDEAGDRVAFEEVESAIFDHFLVRR